MKKICKKHGMSNRDDFPMGHHIHSLRIRAFATESINFTEQETGHFDVCRTCRLEVINALRKGAALVPATPGTTIRQAA